MKNKFTFEVTVKKKQVFISLYIFIKFKEMKKKKKVKKQMISKKKRRDSEQIEFKYYLILFFTPF